MTSVGAMCQIINLYCRYIYKITGVGDQAVLWNSREVVLQYFRFYWNGLAINFT